MAPLMRAAAIQMAEHREFRNQIDFNAVLQRRQFVVNGAFGLMASASAQSIAQTQAFQILKGQCVARDDPRLAK
jgi:hypothetical protein